MLLQDRENVLNEVELLVAGRRDEVIAIADQRLLRRLAGLIHDRDAALLADRRIGEDEVVLSVLLRQRIFRHYGKFVVGVAADAMQQEVHGAEPRDTVDQFDAVERAVLEALLLRLIELVVLRIGEIVVRAEKKTAGTAGRIADRL